MDMASPQWPAASTTAISILCAVLGCSNVNVLSSNETFVCQVNSATYCGCDGSSVVVMTSLHGRYVSCESQSCQSTPGCRNAKWPQSTLLIFAGPTKSASVRP